MKVLKICKLQDERHIYSSNGKIVFKLTKVNSNSNHLTLWAFASQRLDVHILELNEKPYFTGVMATFALDSRKILSIDEVFLDTSRVILVRTAPPYANE